MQIELSSDQIQKLIIEGNLGNFLPKDLSSTALAEDKLLTNQAEKNRDNFWGGYFCYVIASIGLLYYFNAFPNGHPVGYTIVGVFAAIIPAHIHNALIRESPETPHLDLSNRIKLALDDLNSDEMLMSRAIAAGVISKASVSGYLARKKINTSIREQARGLESASSHAAISNSEFGRKSARAAIPVYQANIGILNAELIVASRLASVDIDYLHQMFSVNLRGQYQHRDGPVTAIDLSALERVEE